MKPGQPIVGEMDNPHFSKKPQVTIRDLYPGLTDEELQEADENLERYVELVLRIYERIRSDPAEYARFKSLTASKEDHTIQVSGPDPINKHRSNHS